MRASARGLGLAVVTGRPPAPPQPPDAGLHLLQGELAAADLEQVAAGADPDQAGIVVDDRDVVDVLVDHHPQRGLGRVAAMDADDLGRGVIEQRFGVGAVVAQHVAPGHDPDDPSSLDDGVRAVPARGEALAGMAHRRGGGQRVHAGRHDPGHVGAGEGVDAVVAPDPQTAAP